MCRYGCILVAWCVFMAMMLASASAFSEPTYAEKLGWPAGSRVVIFHVDDAGMSHDSNMGAFEAIEKGVATSTSVMYPCPWVPEFAHYWKNHPDLDAGIHTTLTSEWGEYRWGPLVGKKAAPGRGFTGVYRSSWDAVRAREDFRRIADLLSRYDSWPRSESEAALTQDLASLLGSLSAETLRREAVRDQSMIREVITAGPAPSK